MGALQQATLKFRYVEFQLCLLSTTIVCHQGALLLSTLRKRINGLLLDVILAILLCKTLNLLIVMLLATAIAKT
jgi:hypothetical protein